MNNCFLCPLPQKGFLSYRGSRGCVGKTLKNNSERLGVRQKHPVAAKAVSTGLPWISPRESHFLTISSESSPPQINSSILLQEEASKSQHSTQDDMANRQTDRHIPVPMEPRKYFVPGLATL